MTDVYQIVKDEAIDMDKVASVQLDRVNDFVRAKEEVRRNWDREKNYC